MNTRELEHVLPEPKNIKAIVVFRMAEGQPFTCVATFLAPGDAQIFVANVHPQLGIGQYQVITVDDDDHDSPMSIG